MSSHTRTCGPFRFLLYYAFILGVRRVGFVAHREKRQQDLWLGIEAREVHHVPVAMRPALHAGGGLKIESRLERQHRPSRPEAVEHPCRQQVRREDHRLRSRSPNEPAVHGREGIDGMRIISVSSLE